MSDRPEPAVRCEDVTASHGSKVALSGVNFSVEPGRLLAIVGANGAGKSTLFRAIAGLMPVDEGAITVLGHEASALPAAQRRRVAYVPESHPELASSRVDEAIALRRALYPAFDEPLFRDLVAPVHLGRSSRFGELSRGQRALVVVALALAQKPDLLLLDDPSLGLDPLARRRLVQALLSATRSRSVTMLVATHEIADVERMADDILLLSRGRVASQLEEVEGFVARAAAIRLPLGTPLDTTEGLDAILHVWPRRDHLELIVSGDPDERQQTCDTLSILAGFDVLPRPVSLEDVTLAWLARDSEGASHA